MLNRINVPKEFRGQGYASRLLREVCEAADREGAYIELSILPSGGLGFSQLNRWYKRYGFVDIDYKIHRGHALIREPGSQITPLVLGGTPA